MLRKAFYLGKNQEYYVYITEGVYDFQISIIGRVGNKEYSVIQTVSKRLKYLGRMMLYATREGLRTVKGKQKLYTDNLPFTSKYKK